MLDHPVPHSLPEIAWSKQPDWRVGRAAWAYLFWGAVEEGGEQVQGRQRSIWLSTDKIRNQGGFMWHRYPGKPSHSPGD